MKKEYKIRKLIPYTFTAVSLFVLSLTIILSLFLSQSHAYNLSETDYIQETQQEIAKNQINKIIYNERLDIEENRSEFQNKRLAQYNFRMRLKEDEKVIIDNIQEDEPLLLSKEPFEISTYGEDDAYEELEFTVDLSLKDEMGLNDELKLFTENAKLIYAYRYKAIGIGFISAILMVLSFVFLIKKEDGKTTAYHFLDSIPFDLYTLVSLSFATIIMVILSENLKFFPTHKNIYLMFYLFIIAVLLLCMLSVTYLKSVVVRIQTKELISNNIITRICTKIGRFFKAIFDKLKYMFINFNVSKRNLLYFFAFVFVQILIALIFRSISFIIYFFEFIALIYLVIQYSQQWQAMLDKSNALAKGNLNYEIEHDFKGNFMRLNSDLDALEEGLSLAVDEQMISELMKTELITNVSHDLKTPLTSIITYLDLLKKANEQEQVQYLEVLERQSYKLKTLIDDLLQISKMTSGNVELKPSTLNLNTMMTQVIGEYEEDFVEKNLELIITKPEEEIFIEADGQLLWRVFDNLLGNVFKYSLENTRVYLDILDTEMHTSVCLKNISKDPLHTDAKILMERFIREDKSRNTQGSGLGLSIVKAILDLHHFDFSIIVDGDLFKAEIIIDKKTR